MKIPSFIPGVVLKADFEGAEVSSMVSAGIGAWKWPTDKDILYYFEDDIVCRIEEPKVKNNRGHYSVPEMLNYE